MKSKIFCFNRTIFKKNIGSYWPLWGTYLLYLLLALPVSIWLNVQEMKYTTSIPQVEKQYELMYRTLGFSLTPELIFVFAAVMAMAVFSYLYTSKTANMMHAFPVSRLELYVTNYLSGLAFQLVPQILVFVITVLLCLACKITCVGYLLNWLLYSAGMTFFAYTLAVLTVMFTGQLFAVPFFYLIINYLYIGSVYLVNQLVETLCYGKPSVWSMGKSAALSPVYYLGANVHISKSVSKGAMHVTGLTWQGGKLIAGYAAAACVICVAAYQVYRRRKIETAGDLISVKWLKPLFRWGAALYLGVIGAMVVTAVLQSYMDITTFAGLACGMAVFGVLCFFAAEMLVQKSFHVFHKKRWLECVGCVGASILCITLLHTDVFGIERRLPKEEEIDLAFVNLDYPIRLDADEALQMNQACIDHKKEYLQVMEGAQEQWTNVTFRYYLKDGKRFERRYPLPIGKNYLADETSVTARMQKIEAEPERLMNHMFDGAYLGSEHYSTALVLYNENGGSNTRMLSTEESKKVLDAVWKDVQAGNFNEQQLYCLYDSGNQQVYRNDLLVSCYQASEENTDEWKYYYGTGAMLSHEAVRTQEAVASDLCIVFNPDCTNIVKTLEDLNIVDDTWKLYTYKEYTDQVESKIVK